MFNPTLIIIGAVGIYIVTILFFMSDVGEFLLDMFENKFIRRTILILYFVPVINFILLIIFGIMCLLGSIVSKFRDMWDE